MKFKKIYFVLVILAFLLCEASLFAQVDINVYDQTVYAMIDRLVAEKLIKTYSPHQRPLSRYAIAKMIVEAEGRAGCHIKGDERGTREIPAKNCGDDSMGWIFSELEREFEPELKIIRGENERGYYVRPLDQVNLSWTGTDQPEEPMPVNNLGGTAMKVQPLLAYKDGQHYQRYNNYYFDVTSWLYASPYFAFYVQPQLYSYSGSDPNGGARLYRGYIKTGYKNFEFQIGRDDLFWGPGKEATLFSNNARSQDMIRLTSPSAFRFPWYFKYLGQWRFSAFFSWLGDEFIPHNAILSGYRLDFQPFNWWWWDIGFDHAVIMGGTGMKDPSVKTAIGEFIGFIFDSGNFRASSNHQMGFDMTFHIPPLLGMEIYGKMLLDDTQAEYIYMLKNDAIWIGGLYFPKLDPAGRLSLRGEAVYAGQIYGRNGTYSYGWTLDGKSMGYDAGSDTYSGMVEANYIFNLNEFMKASARYLLRSSNTYATTFNSSGNNDGIVIVTRGVDEHHMLATIAGQKKLTDILNVYGELGLDATKNKGFIQGDNALDFAVQVQLKFHDLTK